MGPWLRLSVLVCCALAAGCARQPRAASVSPSRLTAWARSLHPFLPPPLVLSKPQTLFHEPFNVLDESRWREVEVKGRTAYDIVDLDGLRTLKGHSQGGASVILWPGRFDPRQYPWISWRWRIDQPVSGEDLTRKEGSDASARIYVYFDTAGLPWQKRSVDYVWSTAQPLETVLTSPFSKSSKIIVADTGPQPLGTWRAVARNILEDYQRCFGEDPPNVSAIGIMVDADNTHSEAVAYFDDLMITREAPPLPPDAATASQPAPASETRL